MKTRNAMATALMLACTMLIPMAGLAQSGQEQEQEQVASAGNRRPDGTYVLRTDDLRSIQAYYTHVGVGELILADEAEILDMRETCLSLGEHWRPLGHVNVPDGSGKGAYPFYLCYYVAANPDHVAEAKCANLGLVLLENRAHRREIVCGRPDPDRVARIES